MVQTVTQSLQQQIVLGMHTANMSEQCTDALIGELIKSHNRRDMDHVLNKIPTFNGLELEKFVDWATRIKHACEQSNRNFRQELMNKSELMVQNIIKGLGTDTSDDKVMNRILEFFSDIYQLLTMLWIRSSPLNRMMSQCHSSTKNTEHILNVWKGKL